MKLFLDCCCYNRPYDDQSQDRIHDGSEAVLSIIHRSRHGKDSIVGSKTLELEISMTRDISRRYNLMLLYSAIESSIPYTSDIKKRAEELLGLSNMKTMDSLHVASAEVGGADVFLTTDDKLIKNAKNAELKIRVMNPVTYLAEVIENDK